MNATLSNIAVFGALFALLVMVGRLQTSVDKSALMVCAIQEEGLKAPEILDRLERFSLLLERSFDLAPACYEGDSSGNQHE